MMPSEVASDVEGLLQGDEAPRVAAPGSYRRAAVVSSLTFAAVCVLRWGAGAKAPFLATLGGIVEKEEEHVSILRIGKFIRPGATPTECWTAKTEGLVLETCDESNADQALEFRDYHAFVWGGQCLSATEEGTQWDDCNTTDPAQMFQFPRRGSFGEIGNCWCDPSAECRKSCNNVQYLGASSEGVLRLQDTGMTVKWSDVEEGEGEAGDTTCTANGDDCQESKCCSEAGMTCFKKNENWASCNATCNANMMWNHSTHQWELQEDKIWDCEVLTNEPGPDPEGPEVCTADGQNCSTSLCCSAVGSKCYKKNEHWASCNKTCSPKMLYVHGQGWQEQPEAHWDCEVLSPTIYAPIFCTDNGENCLESKCCAEEGTQCYVKNDHWASCNKTCEQDSIWNHDLHQWEKSVGEKVWECTVLSP